MPHFSTFNVRLQRHKRDELWSFSSPSSSAAAELNFTVYFQVGLIGSRNYSVENRLAAKRCKYFSSTGTRDSGLLRALDIRAMLASALHTGKVLLAPCGKPPLPLPAFPQTTSILTRPEQPPWRPDCLLPHSSLHRVHL